MGKDTILVVDDEPEIRRAVSRHIRARWPRYYVVELRDGAAALDALSPRIALIVCDVNMPRLTGFDLCRSLREAPVESGYTDLPVILLTALDSEADIAKSWASGSTLHLGKPFDPEKLDSALRALLEA
jgi:two-component system chemotaxis response regulator CheY